MSRTDKELDGVTLLGNQNTQYKSTYSPEVLETFENKHKDNDYVVTFDAYEFTSLCPRTAQPDFAKVVISYIPNERMVESKSLKLYLFSFRNQGDFHEDCINMIGKDLVKLMDPKYLEVRGIFASRGGIAIVPFYTYSTKGYEDIEKQRKIDILRDGSNRTAKYDK